MNSERRHPPGTELGEPIEQRRPRGLTRSDQPRRIEPKIAPHRPCVEQPGRRQRLGMNDIHRHRGVAALEVTMGAVRVQVRPGAKLQRLVRVMRIHQPGRRVGRPGGAGGVGANPTARQQLVPGIGVRVASQRARSAELRFAQPQGLPAPGRVTGPTLAARGQRPVQLNLAPCGLGVSDLQLHEAATRVDQFGIGCRFVPAIGVVIPFAASNVVRDLRFDRPARLGIAHHPR